MFVVNSDGKRSGGCIFLVLLLLRYRASSLQFTPKYQGKTVTGLVGSSVNFTWSFSGDVKTIEWGIKNNGTDALNVSTILISINERGSVVVPMFPIAAAYMGRVSGTRYGNSSSFQAVFTLRSIIKEDENDYGCLISRTTFFQTVSEFDYMQLVVEEEPSFTHPTQANATYNEGSAVDISCAAQGTPDPDVMWIYNGQVKSSGSKTSHLIFSPISKADAGMYTCRANNSIGNKEKQLHIVVNYPATITNISSSVSKSWIGQTVTLTCKSNGVPTPTLSWYRPNGTKFKAKENAVVVPLNSDGDFGLYNCTAFNGFSLVSMRILVEQIKAPGPPIVESTEADIQATSLTVKWTEPTDTGGSPITAYRVVMLKGAAEIKNDNITDPAKRSWPVGNLEMNTNYTVKVFARNCVFEGNAIKKTFQTKFEGIPAAAEIIDLPADTKAGEVIIKWNTPKDNGATITQYTVYQRTVSDNGTPRNWIRLHAIIAAVSVRQVAVKLNKGKIYEFVVTATNKRGESSKEEEKIKRITVGDVPEAVVITGKVNDGEITLKWKEPDNNGAAIIQYDVHQRIVKDKWKNIGTIKDTCKLEFVVEGEKGKEYEFAVTATNKYGESSVEDSITKAKVPGETTTPTESRTETTTPTESRIGSFCDDETTLHAVYMTVIVLLLISNFVLIRLHWKKLCRSVKSERSRKCSKCGDLIAMKPLLKTDQVDAWTQSSSEAQTVDAPTYASPVGGRGREPLPPILIKVASG